MMNKDDSKVVTDGSKRIQRIGKLADLSFIFAGLYAIATIVLALFENAFAFITLPCMVFFVVMGFFLFGKESSEAAKILAFRPSSSQDDEYEVEE